jgi:pimeloyl-ACP methyl ester carboxylesterase
MLYAETSIGRVAYEVNGAGPPLLLLPANGHDRHVFEAVVPALARRFTTYAIDWPGMGDSPAPTVTMPASAPMMADLVEELVAWLRLPPVFIVGNSIGGFAALRLAARKPEAVRGLVAVNSGGFTPMNRFARLFCWLRGRRWFTRWFAVAFARLYLKKRTPEVADLLGRIDRARRRREYVEVETDIWRNFPAAGNDVTAEAARVRCPTLLVWGRRDPVSRARVEGRIARRAIAGAMYAEFDCGHVAFAEDPDRFLAVVEPFLRDAASARAA